MSVALQQQERMVEINGMFQRAYTVDEVFNRIDQKLTEAFGEKYTKRLQEEKFKRGLHSDYATI